MHISLRALSFRSLCQKANAGFTLIELLIVIAILGVLATVVFVGLNPGGNIVDTNNSRRATDLSTLDSAIQQYELDQSNASAPSALTGLVPKYLGSLPTDPTTNANYSYCQGTTTSSYALGTTLQTGGRVGYASIMATSSLQANLPAGCTLSPALGGNCGTSSYFCRSHGS